MNTIQELLDNNIDMHTAEMMLTAITNLKIVDG